MEQVSRPPCHFRAHQLTRLQLFNDHIAHLERHTALLRQAAGHFPADAPWIGPYPNNHRELQSMVTNAEFAIVEARKGRMICRGSSHRLDKLPPDHSWSEARRVGNGKRSAEGDTSAAEIGSAKRRRVGAVPNIADLNRGTSKAKPSPKAEAKINEDPFEDAQAVVEYEDVSAEVEARLEASERRRMEQSGEVPRQAVKRKRGRESTGSDRTVEEVTDLHNRTSRRKRPKNGIGEPGLPG